MRNSIWLFLPIAAFAAAGPALALDRTITVEGAARVQVAPDEANLEIGVSTEGNTVAEALNRNAPVMKAVRQAIEQAGVLPKDIHTASFEIAPVNQRLPNGEIDSNRTVAYKATNKLSVDMTALDRIGVVIDAAARAGATDTGSITYSINNEDAVKAKVRADAMRDARRQAEELVAPEHKTVGELIAIGSGASGSVEHLLNNLPSAFADYGSMESDRQTQIVPGVVTISASVTATFALQ